MIACVWLALLDLYEMPICWHTFPFPTTGPGCVSIALQTTFTVTPMPLASIHRGHNFDTISITRTIATALKPPPQLNHLEMDRHRSAIPNYIRDKPRKQTPASHPCDVFIFKKITRNITGIATDVSITTLHAAAIDILEIGLQRGRRNYAILFRDRIGGQGGVVFTVEEAECFNLATTHGGKADEYDMYISMMESSNFGIYGSSADILIYEDEYTWRDMLSPESNLTAIKQVTGTLGRACQNEPGSEFDQGQNYFDFESVP
ncbi:hypothetical protein LXL04_007073 [Taraxacum kok-saghyz]